MWGRSAAAMLYVRGFPVVDVRVTRVRPGAEGPERIAPRRGLPQGDPRILHGSIGTGIASVRLRLPRRPADGGPTAGLTTGRGWGGGTAVPV
jgi:hypothetical protein